MTLTEKKIYSTKFCLLKYDDVYKWNLLIKIIVIIWGKKKETYILNKYKMQHIYIQWRSMKMQTKLKLSLKEDSTDKSAASLCTNDVSNYKVKHQCLDLII